MITLPLPFTLPLLADEAANPLIPLPFELLLTALSALFLGLLLYVLVFLLPKAPMTPMEKLVYALLTLCLPFVGSVITIIMVRRTQTAQTA